MRALQDGSILESPRFLVGYFQAAALEELSAEVWQHWMPEILGNPYFAHAQDEAQTLVDELILLAVDRGRDVVAEIVSQLLVREDQLFGQVFLLDRFNHCWTPEIASAARSVATRSATKSDALESLLKALLKHSDSKGRELAVELLPGCASDKSEDNDRALAAAVVLWKQAPDAGWNDVWPHLSSRKEFARRVFSRFADRWGNHLLDRFTENQLARLYELLCDVFPRSTDPGDEEIVTPRCSASGFRDAVLDHLRLRGTVAAVRELQQLVKHTPDDSMLSWAYRAAQHETLQKTWSPLEPSDLWRITASRTSRMVRSGGELLDVIIESLQFLEQRLQGETPAAPDLWNDPAPQVPPNSTVPATGKPTRKRKRPTGYRPKDENRLSDYIKRHLENDLRQRGIIPVREPDIRRGEGSNRGERIDIHISGVTPVGPFSQPDTIRVIVEVKGCWNAELMTAMETQLRDRYLDSNDGCHGLFLVGWFVCPQWDPDHDQCKQSPNCSLVDIRQKLDEQARQLTSDSNPIRAFVLDCRLR